jgi:exodeoxyribonuclease VII large subunit
MQRVDELEYALRDGVRRRVDSAKRALDVVAARLIQRDVRLQFAEARRRLESHEAQVNQAARLKLSRARESLMPLTAHLTQLSPLKILDRGYAIVEREGQGEGKIVKSSADAPVGSDVRVRLAAGELTARVIAAHERK